jgi:hypothetical protein
MFAPTMRAVFILVALAIASGSAVARQADFVRVSEGQARKALALASATANGNDHEFTSRFDKEIKKIAPDYDYDPMNARLVLGSLTGALAIPITGPVGRFRAIAATAIRKLDSLDNVPWVDGVAVQVVILQITAPDIVKIVVTRDGRNIEPLQNNLIASEQTSRTGAKTILHQGPVFFPTSAFDPGATVVVTAVPESGRNLVRRFTDKELRKIQ